MPRKTSKPQTKLAKTQVDAVPDFDKLPPEERERISKDAEEVLAELDRQIQLAETDPDAFRRECSPASLAAYADEMASLPPGLIHYEEEIEVGNVVPKGTIAALAKALAETTQRQRCDVPGRTMLGIKSAQELLDTQEQLRNDPETGKQHVLPSWTGMSPGNKACEIMNYIEVDDPLAWRTINDPDVLQKIVGTWGGPGLDFITEVIRAKCKGLLPSDASERWDFQKFLNTAWNFFQDLRRISAYQKPTNDVIDKMLGVIKNALMGLEAGVNGGEGQASQGQGTARKPRNPQKKWDIAIKREVVEFYNKAAENLPQRTPEHKRKSEIYKQYEQHMKLKRKDYPCKKYFLTIINRHRDRWGKIIGL